MTTNIYITLHNNQFVLLSSIWHSTILVLYLYNINYRKPITILKYIQTGSLYGTLYVIFQYDSEM